MSIQVKLYCKIFIGVPSGIYVVFFDIQFLQIQAVLQNTGEEGQDELVKLRDDLVELIHVSEGAQLSLIYNNKLKHSEE